MSVAVRAAILFFKFKFKSWRHFTLYGWWSICSLCHVILVTAIVALSAHSCNLQLSLLSELEKHTFVPFCPFYSFFVPFSADIVPLVLCCVRLYIFSSFLSIILKHTRLIFLHFLSVHFYDLLLASITFNHTLFGYFYVFLSPGAKILFFL